MEKKILLMPLGLLFALAVAAFAVPLFVNANSFKPTIVSQLEESTGYSISIDGPVSVRLLPSARIRLEKVTVTSPLLNANTPFARMEVLDVGVKLLPVMRGEVEITRVLLKNPILNLVQNDKGNNWDPKKVKSSRRKLMAQDRKSAESDETEGASPTAVVLSNIVITNGSIKYTDQQTRQSVILSALNLEAGMRSATSPFELKAKAHWNEKPVSLAANLGSIGGLINSQDVKAALDFKSDALNFTMDGMVREQEFSGKLKAKTASLLDTMNWLTGAEPSPAAAKIALSVDSDASLSASQFMLSNANIDMNGMTITGGVKADITQAKPQISANLETDKLDITAYLPKKTASLQLISSAWADESHWSAKPIDLSVLASFNAGINIKAKEFVAHAFTMKDAGFNAKLAHGIIVLDATSTGLYGGKGKASLNMTPDREAQYIVNIDGVDIEPLLKAVADSDRFSGKAAAQFTLSSVGSSPREIVASLDGNGSFSIADGSVNGLDIAGMVRNVKSAYTEIDKTRKKTDFTELGGSFTVKRGTISNNDLVMKAPLLRVSGKGDIDLPNYRINYLLTPHIVDTLKGQGGKDKEGLAVPIRVSGPLDNPGYAPDLASVVDQVVKDPKAFKQNAKELRKDVKGLLKQGKGLLKGL